MLFNICLEFVKTFCCEGQFSFLSRNGWLGHSHSKVNSDTEFHLESIDTAAVIGNGICIHYSLPTESLFLTINTEPNVYKSFCYTNVEISQNSDDPEKTFGIAKNGVWLKPIPPKGSTPSQTPSSESSKGTKSKKYRGALKTSTSTSESSDSGSEKKLNYMRNFTDVNGHPGIVTANYGSNIAIITSQRTQVGFDISFLKTQTVSNRLSKSSTYLKTYVRSISRFCTIKDLFLI